MPLVAVLHSIAESVDEQKLDNIKDGRDAPFDRKELEDMLKRGAYNVFKQDDEEVKRFCEEVSAAPLPTIVPCL